MAGQRLRACKQLELARLCGVLNGLGGWPARRKSRGGSPKGACDGRVKNRGCCGNLGKMRPRPPVPATTRSQAPAEQVGDASPERSRQPRAGSKRWAGYSGWPDQGSRIQFVLSDSNYGHSTGTGMVCPASASGSSQVTVCYNHDLTSRLAQYSES